MKRGAERGLRERQLAHVHEVVALALELGVGRDRDRDVQVARDAAPRRGRAAVGESEPLSAVDPRRHLDIDAPDRVHATLAAAALAGREDAAAGGTARRARRRSDHLAQDRAAHLPDLTRAAAHVAARRVRPGLAPGHVATLARDGQADLHGVDDSEGSLLEGQLDGHLGVVAPGWPGRPAPAAEGVAAEEGIEEVAEPEGVAGLRSPGSPGAGSAVRSEDVVAPAALGVAQRLVRDRDLFEASLGVGVVGVRVGVVLARERAIRAFDVGLGRLRRHAEHVVIAMRQRQSTRVSRRPSCCETTATAPMVRR